MYGWPVRRVHRRDCQSCIRNGDPRRCPRKTDEENVFLKLDKQTIETLPAVPARLRSDSPEVELITLTVSEPDTAAAALKRLKQLAKDNSIAVINAAQVTKDADGKTSLQETEDVSARQGTIFGAITGGLIGLLGGPVGVVVGATAGAVTGRVAAKHIDMGLPDAYLKKFSDHLQPGSSALIILVDPKWAGQVMDTLTQFEGQLQQQTLSEEVMTQLSAGTNAGDE